MGKRLMEGGNEATNGAMPHGQVDEVLPPKESVLALPASIQEPTLSGGITQFAEGEPKKQTPSQSEAVIDETENKNEQNAKDRQDSFLSVLLNPKILCIIFATAIMMAAGKETLASFPQDPSTTARLVKAFSTVFVCIIVYLGVMYFFWKPEKRQ